jgi:adenylate kinase family enzyme
VGTVQSRRILVYGVTGSGKSTIAAGISAATGIPCTHVDDLTWEPGWVAVPDEEQRRRFEAICAGDEWVLDTAYSSWLDVPLARAELVVGLDYSRLLTLWRLIRRTTARVVTKQLVCNGNVETLRSVFSRESIIAWHFHTFASKRRQVAQWCRDSSGPRIVRLTSRRQTEAWLATLR